MERYVRKRKVSGEVAAAGGKNRKIVLEKSEISTSSVQLKTRCLSVSTPENSASPESSGGSTCKCASSDNVLASCCSSSRSSELAEENLKSADLEENAVNVEYFAILAGRSVDFRDSSEMTPSSEVQADSGELESTVRPRELNSRRLSTAVKMPTEAELEEFFAVAEKNLQKQFIDKYNYDVVKDEPLEGRYEWFPVQLKP